ncbi:MAG: hypothetical protein KY443_03820 [Actinobacteria bacterium]|nr:hypothetical protein [Actinomycetota bacterium]
MLRFLLRMGLRKGVMEGSRRWLVIGGAALGVKVLRKLAGSEPEVVLSETLSPGEALVIAHEKDATMRG